MNKKLKKEVSQDEKPIIMPQEWVTLGESKDKAAENQENIFRRIGKSLCEKKNISSTESKDKAAENQENIFRRIGKSLFEKKNISSTEFKKIAEAQQVKEYKYNGYFRFLSWSRLSEWYKNKYLRGRIFFIIMQLRNGKYDMFTIRSILPYFEHRGGMYFIDPDMAREDLHTRHNALYYHQDFAAPFKMEFDVKKIHDVISASDEDASIDKSLNPATFKYVINSQVIEKLIKAHEISDKLKMIVLLVIINLALTAICIFITAKGSGMIH